MIDSDLFVTFIKVFSCGICAGYLLGFIAYGINRAIMFFRVVSQ